MGLSDIPGAELERRRALAGTRSIRYRAGSEYAPDDPFGRTLLWLHRDGRARLGNWHRGNSRAWSGHVDTTVLGQVVAHLQAGGFPDAKPLSLVPGATFEIRILTDSPRSKPDPLTVGDNTHSRNPDYRAAIVLLDSVVRQLSQDTIPVGAAPTRTLVDGVRGIDVIEVDEDFD
ncbi:MAG TPA: hypothetical protein VIO84_02945 [Candidatus Dormibacteraeota bacterium]|jgi:hypothetical protein